MMPINHPHNRRLGAMCALRGSGWFALAMACVATQAHANEAVLPLVIPLIVPESADHEVAPPEDADDGFSGVAVGGDGAESDPGFGADDPPTGAPDLVLPLIAEDDVIESPMPDNPDDEWITEGETATRQDSDAIDPMAVFGSGTPSLGEFWMSGDDSSAGGGPFASGSVIDSLRQGLGLALSLTGTYDSNPSRGYTGEANDGSGDFSLMLGGGISYRSRASTWTYGASYTGGYRTYFSQSDLNGYSQRAGASINYSGGPLTAVLAVGMNFGSGANRNFEAVTDSLSVNYGLNARYQISAKTTVQGDFSQSYTLASGQGNLDTGSFDAGLSGLWKYSPLTEFGPGIRHTRRNQDSGPTRTSIGPTLLVNYQLTGKVSLNSRVGMDFVSIEGAGSRHSSFSTALGLNYRASAMWGVNLSLLRDSRASNTAAGQFEEITALRLGYTRSIRRASWNLGISWETTSVENNMSGSANAPDRDYFAIDTSLGMPIFRSTTQARVFCGYRDENGGNRASDSFQAGFGLSRSF